MNDLVLELLVILLLAVLNAVFVAAEIALITIRRSKVEQLVDEGRRGAHLVRRLTNEPSRLLAVIQIVITFIGFLSSAFAAVNLTFRLEEVLSGVPFLKDAAAGIALIIVTILMSAFFIVFGELVPKTLALTHTERFAVVLAAPVDVIGRLLAPVVWMLTGITGVVSRALGADPDRRPAISTEELKFIAERAGEEGVLEAEEEQMISAVIELGERRVHEVMVPRTQMTALPVTATLGDTIDTIIREGHSRIPVYDGSIDQVVGILYAKDLLPFLKGEDRKPSLRALLRAPLFVPESMSIDDLLHKLQARKVHLAIVLDEYGGTAGLVTIEDLLEEIVGEIQDEYDQEEPLVELRAEDEVRVDGRAAVEDLGEALDVDLSTLEDAAEYDTVGGLVYHRVGGVPRPGDKVEIHEHDIVLTVESITGRRVGKVLAVRRRPDGDTAQEAGD